MENKYKNENELILLAKDFLDNFSLDFVFLKSKLEKIAKAFLTNRGYKSDVNITFDESELFGKSGSVFGSNISFNKTRLEILAKLKIDDLNSNHLKRLEEFYSEYLSKLRHTKFEDILFTFIKRYKEMNAEYLFSKVGSYKTIRFELLDTVFHECEHLLQESYKKYMYSNDFNVGKDDLILIFTITFNTLYEKLQKAGIKFKYTRENYIFPIEFDARYVSFCEMLKISKLLSPNKQDILCYLKNSNIAPSEFDAKRVSEKIFNDYLRLERKCANNNIFNNASLHSYIVKNKNVIIKEFIYRYSHMNNI